MKRVAFLVSVLFVLGATSLARADGQYGKDITITGKVVQAVVDDASGKVYVLEPGGANQPLPPAIKIGSAVTVDGDEMTQKGHMAIRVERAK